MGLDAIGIGSIADLAKTIVNKIFGDKLSDAEKSQAELEVQKLIGKREEVVVSAQRDIIIAELQQKDKYTKRARPTIIYAGLAFIGLNHVVFPCVAYIETLIKKVVITLPSLSLPAEFWAVWGGVCGLYIWNRTKEKETGKESSSILPLSLQK